MATVEQTITLDDLVRRLDSAARAFSKRNPNRLLLLNAAAALTSVGLRLEAALAEIARLNLELEAQQDARHTILLPGGGEHRVN